jgi:pimeloyl-ACP methyl ester carboxylesterase
MGKIYCLSGLGADERIYSRLRLHNRELVHIPWPEHDEYDELPCYAQKVSSLIKDDNPIIMGVSLGGMIGIEISKMRPVKKLILISSAKTRSEMPSYDGWFGKLIKSKILPPFVYKMPNQVLLDKFGAETEEDEALLRAILKDSDGRFMKWAMRAVALWRNDNYLQPVSHMHGRKDHMIFPQNVHADHWIEDGGHMMVYNRAEQVSRIIEQELEGL